jgi:hypothetical protein
MADGGHLGFWPTDFCQTTYLPISPERIEILISGFYWIVGHDMGHPLPSKKQDGGRRPSWILASRVYDNSVFGHISGTN